MTSPTTPMKAIPALLAALAGAQAQAGSLDPALEAAAAQMRPGEIVDVIVRCADPLDPAAVPPGELVRALQDKARACETSLSAVLENTAVEPPKTLWIVNGIAAKVPVAALHGLVNRAGVDVVYLNETVTLAPDPVPAGAPSDPAYTYWNISETRAPDLWGLGHYGTGAVVATMDTGVDALHADIGPKWRGGANSWYDPSGQHPTPHDVNGHGTRVMGLIVGGNATGFDMGMAPDARWIAVKLFDDQGQSSWARIHQGFQWLLDPDGDPESDDAPHLVNNSWVLQGTENQCLTEFTADVAALRAAGIGVVFSAGNSGPAPGTSMTPANDPGSLSVGAADAYEAVLSTSSRGPSACGGGTYPRLVAPGDGVLTAGLTVNGLYPAASAFGTGTSFAAPHVAGAMAVLRSAFPDRSMTDIQAALEGGAFDLGADGPDNDSGAGLLDVVGAYVLLGGTAPPPPPPDADRDGVPDALDLCPGTPAGSAVDAKGCAASQRDADGDGVPADRDCNDANPTIHPGATEVRFDGIDQDCNGYDLTINVTSATYTARGAILAVTATSILGKEAALEVVGYGAMTWDAKKSRWTFSKKNAGAKPATVTVKGREGQWTSAVR